MPYPSARKDCMRSRDPCASPRPVIVPVLVSIIHPKEPYPFFIPPSDTMVMSVSVVTAVVNVRCCCIGASVKK